MTRVPPPAPRASPARRDRASDRRGSRQGKLLLELRSRDLLSIAGLTALETPRIGKLADHDGIEACVAHQTGSNFDSIDVVAGDRNCQFRIGAVRLAGEDRVAHGVEGARDAYAGKVFLRRHTNAVLLDLIGDVAVTRGHRVAGIQHDL